MSSGYGEPVTRAYDPLADSVTGEEPSLEAQRNLAVLFQDHGAWVFRTLTLLGVARSEAPDAVQEVFIVAFRRLPDFDGRLARAWLRSICLRVASDFRRRQKRRGERETRLDSDPQIATALDPERLAAAREAHKRLEAALGQLDADKRNAFVLYCVEQLTLREIAEETSVPLATAASRVRAARQLVQAYYDAQRDSEMK